MPATERALNVVDFSVSRWVHIKCANLKCGQWFALEDIDPAREYFACPFCRAVLRIAGGTGK